MCRLSVEGAMVGLTLNLDWELNCQFAGLIWAMDAGFLKDVTVVPPSAQSGAPVLELLEAGVPAVATVEENLLVGAVASGQTVRALGAMLQRSPLVLMTAQTGPVRGLGDLVGGRVAMHADGAQHLRALLRLDGIDPAAVDIAVGGWSMQDLIAGSYGAVQGYAITEAAALQSQGFAARLIPLHHAALSPHSIVMVARTEVIAAHRPALRAMLRAIADGWRQVLHDPQTAARRVAAYSAEHADVQQNCAILERIAPYVRRRPEAAVLRLDAAQWARNLQSFQRLSMLDTALNVQDVIAPEVFG